RRRRAVGRARARGRLPHVPRARPSLGDGGRAARHAGDRAGRELQDPLDRGHARDVALPLPRREPHDERDDRDLPGDPMTRRFAGLVPVAGALGLVTAAGSADAPTRTVTMPGKLYDPTQLSVLVG